MSAPVSDDAAMTPDEWKAEQAFQVWSALCQAMAERPELASNSYFIALCQEVGGDFQSAFERLG